MNMRNKEKKLSSSVRVALYIRVSKEEQKIKGLSLEAQQERLEEYARQQGWVIVGIYIDAAKTARKNIHKRIEFQKMMEVVKRDEVDILLFCRLDRWFRSVADYYKIMEVLQAHNCNWKTIDEDYDTTSASGRLYINVKLSIAQNEADMCGERIGVIFDSKIMHGTVISGHCPFGFQVNKEKRLEISQKEAQIVVDAFNYFENTVSQRKTAKHIRETYGVNWCQATFKRMLSEKLYIGIYDRGNRINENFCPAIISKEQYERVQILLKRNTRSVPSGRIYIFTSILKCNECHHNMVGHIASKSKHFYYYRCNQHFQRGCCDHKIEAREDRIEQWLFDNLESELNRVKLEWETKVSEKKKANLQIDKAVLKRKLSRLKELYVNELIEIEEYKRDYEIYSTALQQIPEPIEEPCPDFSAIERLIQPDYKKIYESLTRDEKRTLWRSVISEIRIDSENNITSVSFG